MSLLVTNGISGERALLMSPALNLTSTQCVKISYNIMAHGLVQSSELTVYDTSLTYPLSGRKVGYAFQPGEDQEMYIEVQPGQRQLIIEGTLGDISSKLSINSIEKEEGSCQMQGKYNKLC